LKSAPVRSLRLSAIAGLCAAMVLVVAWSAIAAVLNAKWQEEIASERRQNENLSNALTEQTVRIFATIDQALIRVQEDFASVDARKPDLVRYANETGLSPGILVQMSLIDADGRLISSNLDPEGSKTNHVDLSTREHVRVHLHPELLPPGFRRPPRNSMFVGKPVIGKVSGKWTIQLSRKISDARGQPRGVVVASLDPTYFEDVYRRVSLGRTGGVSLVGADLSVRARVIGGVSQGMGTALHGGSALEREIAIAGHGSFIGLSQVDGIERITGYRQVAHYPLYLAVSTGKEEALASWRGTRDMMLVLASLLSIVVIVAAVNFSTGLRGLERGNDALRVSEAKANAANQAKTEFLCAMSHELRTPLTSIRGFAELMEHRLEQPKFREQAKSIRKGAEYLNRLLTEILDMAKVDAGAMELSLESLELRPLVLETSDFFALAAEEKGLTLTAEVAPDVPDFLLCDGLRLKQILNNLLSNAVKFTASGGVAVSVRVSAGQLQFDVADTGPGVPVDMQEAIFEKFRQGDARVSYEHGGTGLGLPLSRGLAGLLKGSLTLQSDPGAGSCFSLMLPLEDIPAPSHPAVREPLEHPDVDPAETERSGARFWSRVNRAWITPAKRPKYKAVANAPLVARAVSPTLR